MKRAGIKNEEVQQAIFQENSIDIGLLNRCVGISKRPRTEQEKQHLSEVNSEF